MARTGISEEFADQIVSTARRRRPAAYDVLYVRSDLYGGDTEAARDAKQMLVENERLGFDSRETYEGLTNAEEVEPAIGEYEFTIRVFSDGFVNRVLTDDHGIVLTTNALYLNEFEELAVSLRTLLTDNEAP